MDTYKIVRWVGNDGWLKNERGVEIGVNYNDLILVDGNKVITGFMTEFLKSASLEMLNTNTVLHKWVSSPEEYQRIYEADLERRHPNAEVFATVDAPGKPALQSKAARTCASKFGVTFGK